MHCLCTTCMQHPRRPGEDVRSPGTGARAACELPCRPWELNTGPPKEEPVLLTPESFLQGLISKSSQGLRFGRGGGAGHAHFILENTVQKCGIYSLHKNTTIYFIVPYFLTSTSPIYQKDKRNEQTQDKSQTMNTCFIISNDSISHGETTLCAVPTGHIHHGNQVGDMRLWPEQHGSPIPGHMD